MQQGMSTSSFVTVTQGYMAQAVDYVRHGGLAVSVDLLLTPSRLTVLGWRYTDAGDHTRDHW